MPFVKKRNILSGIPVIEAMRRQVVRLDAAASIRQGIRLMIRYKANAVLLTEHEIPCGVVSKTDLLSAFYVELPTETPLADVMGSQPIACYPDDTVEDALEIMDAAGVHRLYVTNAKREDVIGTVAYAEIVGLLYRYCRSCERGTARKRVRISATDPAVRLTVREVMTPDVRACRDNDQLIEVIDALSTHHLGAVLIRDEVDAPVGVISKSDLIIAYQHGISPQTVARNIMHTPVHSVAADDLLSGAIEQMLIRDLQRLFVHQDASDPKRITGVLALSDSARFRSGSCRACTAGRMLTR